LRIPKRVNAAWDWADSHPRVSLAAILLPILAAGALWIPLLAAFVMGLLVGGLVIHYRLHRRIGRLRREVDALLRENGKLVHRNTVLASGVVESGALVTQQILTIPEEAAEATGEPGEPVATVAPAEPPEAGETGETVKTIELTQIRDEDLIQHRKSA
jgi:hypothetical protein